MKRAIAIFLALSMAVLPGCWDSREINELGLVIAVGIDKAANSNNYIITVQIANPKPSSPSENGKTSTSEAVFVLSAEGKTLFDATRQLIKTSSKRIMWAHDYIIIIGESVARDSITPVVDYFTHNPELRMKTPVVVTKGNALVYLSIISGMEDMPGVAFSGIYGYSRLTAEYIETDLLSLCQDYYSEYTQPLISEISLIKNKSIPGDEASGDLKDQVQFGGSAVFQKDRMLGWLTPEETKGLAWVLNQTGDTLVTVQGPSQPGKSVSIEIKSASAKITTSVDEGKPSVMIDISGSGSIVEEDGSTTLPMDEYKKTLEGFVDENIGNTIRMSLDKIQKEYQSDVLGLAKHFHIKHNNEWNNDLKNKWNDIYPQLPVTVNVNITINESTIYQIPESNAGKD